MERVPEGKADLGSEVALSLNLMPGDRFTLRGEEFEVNRPSVLFADEPTGNLDDYNAEVVLEYISEFASEGGAVLLVTHDKRLSSHAHRSVKMKDGRFVV